MNRSHWIGIAAIVVAVVGLVGVGAYAAGSHWDNWDHRNERVVQVIDTQDQQQAGNGAVVRVVEPARYHYGFGFFPGVFLFPLFIFGIFWLIFGAFGRRRWNGGPWNAGPWHDGPNSFEEWHRRQHAPDTAQQPPADTQPRDA